MKKFSILDSLGLLLHDCGQAERLHPLRHALLVLCSEVVGAHVLVRCLEAVLAVVALVLCHRADGVGRKQDGPAHLVVVRA